MDDIWTSNLKDTVDSIKNNNNVYTTGKVVKVEDFGCFVELWPGCEGLVHVSHLANERVEKPSDVVKVGDEIKLMATGKTFTVAEVGYFAPGSYMPVKEIKAGEVGYIAASIKSLTDIQVGDTVTDPQYGLEMARYNWANELYRDADGNYPYKHIYPNGKPDKSKVPAPKVIESSNAITSDMYCSLVTLRNIRFTDPKVATGVLPWATKEQTVNRTAEFADGSTIVVRTSGYSNFYADFIPTGVGSITGILSIFGSTKQFYIRDRNDIHNFIED